MLKFSIGAENPNAERTLVDITDEEKELFKYGEVRCFIRFLDDNTEMNESNYLKKVSFENLRYVPDEGFIGGAVAKRVTLELYNENNTFNIENKEFELFLGIVKDDGTTKYISYGNYIIQKPENDNVKDNTSFEALDYMIKFNKTYEDKLKRNCTLLELFQSICEQAGVSTDVTSFRNSSFVVSSGMFVEGESLRDVLIAISQVAFTWARIGVDNKMYMDFEIKTTPVETLNNEEYYELSFNDDYTPLNKIVFATRDVEGEEVFVQDIDSINTYGENALVIYDNPIAYTEEDRVILLEAAKELFGLTYKPLSMKTVGYVFLDETDLIAVTDMQGQTYKTYVFDHSFEYIGTISDTIENQAMTDNEVEYEFQGTLSTQFKKTQVIVDKTNQKVTILTQKSEEFSETLTQLEVNVGTIQAKVNNLEEFTRTKEQLENLYIPDAAEGLRYILDFYIYGDTENFTSKNITIATSEHPRTYGISELIITESEENILMEDNEEILYGLRNYYTSFIELELDDVLRDLTVGENYYRDYIHILQDGTIEVVRQIGVDENGELYVLQPEQKTVLEDKYVLETLKKGTYYFIEELGNLNYKAKYITKNDMSNNYYTKYESEAAINLAKNSIEIYVQEETNTDKLISKINLKPGLIDITGTVTANENFKILPDGSMEAKNGSFSGNIYLEDGNAVIGGKGIYTNLQFLGTGIAFNPSGTNFNLVGYYDFWDGTSLKTWLDFYVDIPDGFTIDKAFITLVHQPVNWTVPTSASAETKVKGYCRSLRIYNSDTDNAVDGFWGGEWGMTEPSTDLIGDAMTSWTPSSTNIQEKISNDISSFIEGTGLHRIIVRSSSNVSYSSNEYTRMKNFAAATGSLLGVLNVYGYMQVK